MHGGRIWSSESLQCLHHHPFRLRRLHRCSNTKAFIALLFLLGPALSASRATETQEPPNATAQTLDSNNDSTASNPSKPPKITPFNFTLYHSSDALLREIRALAARHPHAAEVSLPFESTQKPVRRVRALAARHPHAAEVSCLLSLHRRGSYKQLFLAQGSSGGLSRSMLQFSSNFEPIRLRRSVQLFLAQGDGAAIGEPSVRAVSDAENKGTGVPGDAATAEKDSAIALGDVATAHSDVASANGDVAGARESAETTAADEGTFSGFGGDAQYFKRQDGRSNESCSSADTVEGLSSVLPSELSGKLRILLAEGGGEKDEEGEDKEGEMEVEEERSGEETGVGQKEEGAKEGSGEGISWEQLALIWRHLVITVG
ncbi:unnamed protein product [Closterium sp. Yama58-4]|nr:unnamed protein product [Closterium sp. Yama58-4]